MGKKGKKNLSQIVNLLKMEFGELGSGSEQPGALSGRVAGRSAPSVQPPGKTGHKPDARRGAGREGTGFARGTQSHGPVPRNSSSSTEEASWGCFHSDQPTPEILRKGKKTLLG